MGASCVWRRRFRSARRRWTSLRTSSPIRYASCRTRYRARPALPWQPFDVALTSRIDSRANDDGGLVMEGGNQSSIVETYRVRTKRAAARYREACEVLPGGIVHDSRRMKPYGIYGDRALGSRKWDIDGNEYVDYYGGHGALLLGHQHPEVLKAIQVQLGKGMHLAAAHELEVEWASLIVDMVPSAERVRFTASGTEATQLAMRLARAHSGKSRIVRFQTHFHGWHDQAAFGVHDHLDGSASVGVLPGIADATSVLPPNDVAAVERLIVEHKDVAAVMIEPVGSSSGIVPTTPEVLGGLREVT